MDHILVVNKFPLDGGEGLHQMIFASSISKESADTAKTADMSMQRRAKL
jgi:hypothetical protein